MDPKFSETSFVAMDEEKPSNYRSHHQRSISDPSLYFATTFNDLLRFEGQFGVPSPVSTTVVPMAIDSPVAGHRRKFSLDSNITTVVGLSESEDEMEGEDEWVMDESWMTSFETKSERVLMDAVEKAVSSDKLADLAVIDPERAERIHGNICYTSELVRSMEEIRAQEAKLLAQNIMLEKKTLDLFEVCLELESKELKISEREARLEKEFDELMEKRQRLVEEFAMRQEGMPLPSQQPFNGQNHPNFMDFNKFN